MRSVGLAKRTGGRAIETAVTLPDGTKVADAAQLRGYLVEQNAMSWLNNFVAKLLDMLSVAACSCPTRNC